MKKITVIKLLLLTGIFCLSFQAMAQQKIFNLAVEGNDRTEPETIASYITLRPGDVFNPDEIDKSIENLYATGFFSDVSVYARGGTLVINVKENPIVNQVAFEGNKRIADDDLKKEIRLRERAVYSKTDLQNDTTRVIDIYNKSGRYSVKVEPKLIMLEQNRVNVVFEIDEGKNSEVAKIAFSGNNSFGDTRLRGIVQTKETHWWRFLTSDDSYDADRIEFDKELLRKFYTQNGYADFQVVSTNVELDPASEDFYINYVLEEGIKYKFGNIEVTSEIKDVDPVVLQKVLKTKSDKLFNAQEIEDSVAEITKQLGNLGYAFVDIDPDLNKNKEVGTVDLTYKIKEGPRVYIERINIEGNSRTLDKVIRREFRIAEGDAFNSDKIKRSQQRVRNLNFFDKVDIKSIKGSAPDKMDIDVEVAEKSTGELNLGGGFSTSDGALANISLVERNLFGAGYNTRLSLLAAQKRQEIDFGFTDPYFLDKEFAAGFDIYSIRRDRRSESSFDSSTTGFNLRGSYPLSEYLTHSIKYTFKNDDIRNIRSDASRFIKKVEGKRTTSMIGHSFLYDKTDDRFDPKEGYFIRVNQDFAGLGGDNKFIRHELRAGYFTPTFNKDWVLKVAARTGYVFGINDEDVDINNRFFLGGADLRGFRSDGVGPRDIVTRDALGGNTYYSGSIEMEFPLGLPPELGFKGAAFADIGSLFNIDESGPEIEDDNKPRSSAGVGVSWNSPLGPVRVDIAKALSKNQFDETEIFRISFGTKF